MLAFSFVVAAAISIGTRGDNVFTSYIPMVGFTQGQTTHLHLTQGETLNYNKLVTRVHSDLDTNGVFTAQIEGLYAFHFYSVTKVNTRLWLEIMLNGNLVASAFAHTDSKNGYADAGNSVILQLQNGDRVYVKAHDQYENTIYGGVHDIYTTFTGVLLDSGYLEADGLNRNAPTGFSVGLSHHQSITNGSKVAFDLDLMGSSSFAGYNFTTDEFTAPYEGLYIFHFHALAKSNKVLWMELFNNDQYVLSAYAHTTNEFGDAGNTAILRLMQNDHVTIKARPGRDVELFGSHNQVYATFSGALLSPSIPGEEKPSEEFEEMAFTVGLTHNTNLSAHSKVPYDRLYSNYGNGYDINTRVFTAKTHGLYMFHFHGLSQHRQKLYFDLYHNYQYVLSAYAYDATSFSAGSNSATLSLVSGDQVYVSVRRQSGIFGANDQVYCSFSGYLVAPFPQYQPIVG